MRKLIALTIGCLTTLVLGTAPVQAGIVLNEWNTVNTTLFNPCLGEPVYFEGEQHLVVSNLPKGALNIRWNIKGTGTGLVSGDVWTYLDSTTNILPLGSPIEPQNWTIQRTIRLIGQAGLPSSSFKITAHLTVIDGVPVVDRFEIGGFCTAD